MDSVVYNEAVQEQSCGELEGSVGDLATLSNMHYWYETPADANPNLRLGPVDNDDTQWIDYHFATMTETGGETEARFAAECLLELAGVDFMDEDSQEQDVDVDVVNDDIVTQQINSETVCVPLDQTEFPTETELQTGPDGDHSSTAPAKPRRKIIRQSRKNVSKYYVAGVRAGMISEFDVAASGPLHLTPFELKVYARSGKTPPQQGPLNQHQIEQLKLVRKRIQQQMTAWTGKQRFDDYIKQLEAIVKNYDQENGKLRHKVAQAENDINMFNNSDDSPWNQMP